jgi:hypothetical protein
VAGIETQVGAIGVGVAGWKTAWQAVICETETETYEIIDCGTVATSDDGTDDGTKFHERTTFDGEPMMVS